MTKIDSGDAFDILVKNDKKELLRKFGTEGLWSIKCYFKREVDVQVDPDAGDVKAIYLDVRSNGPYFN